MSAYEVLERLSIELPPLSTPVASVAPFVQVGDFLYLSGHIAKRDGKPWTGKLGSDLTTAEGAAAARAVAIDLLGTLHAASGDLSRIKRIVKALVLVNSSPTFTEPHLVANGASELLITVLGEAGPHARSAVCVAQLPFGACVEVELIAAL